MKRKALISAAIVVALSVISVLVWQVQEARAREERINAETLRSLSNDDIAAILESQRLSDPGTVAAMGEHQAARRTFLEKMRGVMALAAQARKEGLADTDGFKFKLETQTRSLLASMFFAGKTNEEIGVFLNAESIREFWTPENEERFALETRRVRELHTKQLESREMAVPPNFETKGEKLEKAKQEWARNLITSQRVASTDGFVARRDVRIRLELLEAGILAAEYIDKHWREKIKATDEEKQKYLSENPQFDIAKKSEKAEQVLKRLNAGEDFVALAAEVSEDRSTRSKGGLYENVDPEILWPEVVAAAFKEKPGRIVQTIVESDIGYHVVRMEGTQTMNGPDGPATKISLRHILLQKAFEEPNSRRPDVAPPFMRPDEIAKAEVERIKLENLVKSLAKNHQIVLPDDFDVPLASIGRSGETPNPSE